MLILSQIIFRQLLTFFGWVSWYTQSSVFKFWCMLTYIYLYAFHIFVQNNHAKIWEKVNELKPPPTFSLLLKQVTQINCKAQNEMSLKVPQLIYILTNDFYLQFFKLFYSANSQLFFLILFACTKKSLVDATM